MTVPSKTTISATMPTTVRVFQRNGSGEFTMAVLASGVVISGPFRERGCQVNRCWGRGLGLALVAQTLASPRPRDRRAHEAVRDGRACQGRAMQGPHVSVVPLHGFSLRHQPGDVAGHR